MILYQSDRFVIRTFRSGDEASLALQANCYEIWETMRDVFPHPYTYDDATYWVQSNITAEKQLNFAIVIDGDVAGCIGIIPGDDIYKKNLQIGYWIGKDYWNKGIITTSVNCLLEYCFNNFNVNKVWASTFSTNKASVRVLEKCGFKYEATLTKHIFKNGKFIDEKIYSVIR